MFLVSEKLGKTYSYLSESSLFVKSSYADVSIEKFISSLKKSNFKNDSSRFWSSEFFAFEEILFFLRYVALDVFSIFNSICE